MAIKGGRATYIGLAAIALLLGGFGLLADEVVEGDTLDFDKAILQSFRVPGNLQDPIGSPWVEEAVRDITSLGSVALLTLFVVLTVVLLLLSNRVRTAFYLAFAVVGGTIISSLLKSIFDRPRPDLTGVVEVFNSSFPSGHATASAVVYLTMGAILAEMSPDRRHKTFYLSIGAFLTIIVGLSRIYLGVHYPTDVVAGWSIGAAWALTCLITAHLVNSRRSTEPKSQIRQP